MGKERAQKQSQVEKRNGSDGKTIEEKRRERGKTEKHERSTWCPTNNISSFTLVCRPTRFVHPRPAREHTHKQHTHGACLCGNDHPPSLEAPPSGPELVPSTTPPELTNKQTERCRARGKERRVSDFMLTFFIDFFYRCCLEVYQARFATHWMPLPSPETTIREPTSYISGIY